MNFLMHLLSHAVLDRHKKNLKKLRDQLDSHEQQNTVAARQHTRLLFVQQQLHQAMKVHLFRRDLLSGLRDVKEDATRARVYELTAKLQNIEREEQKLAQDIARKTQLHNALNERITKLEREVDDVISMVGTADKTLGIYSKKVQIKQGVPT